MLLCSVQCAKEAFIRLHHAVWVQDNTFIWVSPVVMKDAYDIKLLLFFTAFFPSRLSYSKNGVIRMDGFSTPDQFDDEALSLWVPGLLDESHLDSITAKYILSFIGDMFCQMVVTENTAATWVKKDGKVSLKMADILIK